MVVRPTYHNWNLNGMFEKQLKFMMKLGMDDTDVMQKVHGTAKQIQKEFNDALKIAFGGAQGSSGGGAAGGMNVGMNNFYKQMAALQKNSDNAMRGYARDQMKLTGDLVKEETKRHKLLQEQDKISKAKNK